jgi:hypothetical protein
VEQPFRDDGEHTIQAVAVMRAAEDADAARRRLEQSGVAAADMRVDDDADDVASLRAEMRSELENAVVSPQAAVAWPKEGFKGMLAVGIPATAIFAVLLLPLLMWSTSDFALWVNIVLALTIGALAGGTLALVAGAAAARGPAEPLAAEVGWTMRVANATPEVVDILRSFGPIRLDLVLDDGTPTGETIFEPPDHSIRLEGERLIHQTDTDWTQPEEQFEAREERRVASDPTES